MGAEARCRARFGGATHDGKALLETDELLFRGDAPPAPAGATRAKGPRLAIPLAAIREATVVDDDLRIRWDGGDAAFALGAAAPRWAERIRHPRSLLDKLDVKSGHTVSVVHLDDGPFIAELRARAARVVIGRLATNSDVILLGAERALDLARLGAAVRAMARDGAVWVVHPKGRGGLPDTAVFAAAKSLGLTYTKVARFSPTHTAEKLVVPRARR